MHAPHNDQFVFEFPDDLSGNCRITNTRTGQTFEVPFAAMFHAVAEDRRTRTGERRGDSGTAAGGEEVTTTIASARDLYDRDAGFRALIQTWVDERRCPFPMADYLKDFELESQAACAWWAATELNRRVFLPQTSQGERGGVCGPYPSRVYADRWFWGFSGRVSSHAHHVPFPIRSADGQLIDTSPTNCILMLLDAWEAV